VTEDHEASVLDAFLLRSPALTPQTLLTPASVIGFDVSAIKAQLAKATMNPLLRRLTSSEALLTAAFGYLVFANLPNLLRGGAFA